jgi:hypothetical protein
MGGSTARVPGSPGPPTRSELSKPSHCALGPSVSVGRSGPMDDLEQPSPRFPRWRHPYARSLLLAKVRAIYSVQDLLLFHDRGAVYQSFSLEDRLDFPTPRLKRWINQVTPIIKISLTQSRARPPGNRDIRDFFSLCRPPDGLPITLSP